MRDPVVEIDPICIECGKLAVWTPGRDVYPGRPELWDKGFFVCVCGARVGCHAGTGTPLGLPCGPLTSRARDKAHRVFDVLWRRKAELAGARRTGPFRKAAYLWLSEQLGIAYDQCHISWFDRARAEQVFAICKPYADRIAAARRTEGARAYSRRDG